MKSAPKSETPLLSPATGVAARATLKRGDHLVWLAGATLSLAILLIVGLLLLVFVSGFAFFWPHRVTSAERAGAPILGVVSNEQPERKGFDGQVVKSAQTQFKVGNRELYGFDFLWVQEAELTNRRLDPAVVALEREEYGDFYGYLVGVERDGKSLADAAGAWNAVRGLRGPARDLAKRAKAIQKHEIGEVNSGIQRGRLALRGFARETAAGRAVDPAKVAKLEQEVKEFETEYARLRLEAEELGRQSGAVQAVMRAADGREKRVALADIVRIYRPNQMNAGERVLHYLSRLAEFVFGEPRESNTEGGVFPAIFGTVAMTVIMSLVVTPFGVVAAFYLREYAKQGPVVRLVRIAINNLAGVPSIVFGVFGLGFFVYFIGGGIDRIFFPEMLPTPTFGTGGILWASLTLALLAVPVVIVATEESIAAVPRGTREASLALGASKWQTLRNVVLPASVPGILTGVILSMARGAGEVAPLMITGVVKLAPELPLDGSWPFVHLDRKFMHLGFHIYDVGFQSPNIEAAKPMVFTTTLLLIAIVVLLNLFAIRLRDRIRRRYSTGAF